MMRYVAGPFKTNRHERRKWEAFKRRQERAATRRAKWSKWAEGKVIHV